MEINNKNLIFYNIVAGDLQAGTYGGYGLIWSLFLATFCGLVIQILAARLAIVTNRDLATHCREQFSRPLTYTLWFMAEIAIIGSDIQVSFSCINPSIGSYWHSNCLKDLIWNSTLAWCNNHDFRHIHILIHPLLWR